MAATATHLPSRPRPRAAVRQQRSTLEQFAAGIEAIAEEEKATLGPADARAMYRLVRLAGLCEVWGRRSIAEARSVRQYARGIWHLASHYMMEMNNGHAVTHGMYDDVAGSRLDSATFVWKSPLVPADWAVVHNPHHHVFTNQVGKDVDFGFAVLRMSGKTPWRPWHLLQPVLFLGLSLNMTVWLPAYPAVARARHEGRPVWSRQTFEPVLRAAFTEWRRNYVTEPLRAGIRFPMVFFGNYCAKVISNAYVGFLIGADHHATELLDFDPDPEEPREASYLRQVLGTQNWRTATGAHEDLFALGVCNHIEHHLFPDLPVHRLRSAGAKVRALCETHGIPHVEKAWHETLLGLAKAVVAYSLPLRTTPAREKKRALYTRLVDELRATRSARADATEAPSAEARTYDVYLAKRRVSLPVSSSTTLLDALDAAGMPARAGCRKGACKSCAVTKISGRTSLERHRERRTIELCVARPESDLVLDL